jgi:hypothetical protein
VPELSDIAKELLTAAHHDFEQDGKPTHVGNAVEPDNRHETARELVRAGMAEWHPPIRPVSRAELKRAGSERSAIRRMIAAQDRIIPSARGRALVEGVDFVEPIDEAQPQGASTPIVAPPAAFAVQKASNPAPEQPRAEETAPEPSHDDPSDLRPEI